MTDTSTNPKACDWLPRLPESFYQGESAVFWTHTVQDRREGWLNAGWHAQLREMMLHTCHRFHLVCPVYVAMPDHVHLIWLGNSTESDQRKATTFLRSHLKPGKESWQNQRFVIFHKLKHPEPMGAEEILTVPKVLSVF
jgi:putative transposase